MKDLKTYVAEAMAASPEANRKQIADNVIASMKADGQKVAFTTRTEIFAEIRNIEANQPGKADGDALHPSVMAAHFMNS